MLLISRKNANNSCADFRLNTCAEYSLRLMYVGKKSMFYTLATFHKMYVKKVTKSFHLDVTNRKKFSIIIVKCIIVYTLTEISNWRRIFFSEVE